jgi:hypothetical protein
VQWRVSFKAIMGMDFVDAEIAVEERGGIAAVRSESVI